MIWYGGYLEIGAVITQKYGDNLCMIGTNVANVSADYIADRMS